MSSIRTRSRWLAAAALAACVTGCGGPEAVTVPGAADSRLPQGEDVTAIATAWCRDGGLAFVESSYGEAVRFVQAHPTTVASFELWADTRHGVDGVTWSPTARSEAFAALCVYEGDFSQVPKGPPHGVERTDYTRLSVVAGGPDEFRLYEVGDARVMDAQEGPPPPPPGFTLREDP